MLIRLLSVNPRAIVIVNLSAFDFDDFDSFLLSAIRFNEMTWVLTFPDLSLEALVRGTGEGMCVIDLEGDADELKRSLTVISEKKAYICPKALERIATSRSDIRGIDVLTRVEKEILKLIASGKTVKEIAELRFNSVHTIVTHKKNIFRKLDVNTTQEAVKYALRSGLVDLIDYYI